VATDNVWLQPQLLEEQTSIFPSFGKTGNVVVNIASQRQKIQDEDGLLESSLFGETGV
jgi:hypothetical protein